MIENPTGVVRYYRRKLEQENLFKAFDNLALKNSREKLEFLLNEGILLNQKVKEILKSNKLYNLKTAVDFLIKMSLLSTVLPFQAGEVVLIKEKKVGNRRIINLIKKLRAVSYYPKFIEKVVIPIVTRELDKIGIYQKDAAKHVTLQEILRKGRFNIKTRILNSRKGKFFIYENLNGYEKIKWVKNPMPLIKKIEGINKNKLIIKGNSAFSGKVKGRVKIVLTNQIDGVDFEKRNILVSISTSPELMPLIKRCAAIVTDEGGVTSHAAIISRELKIPCIVGTKIATKVLKNGDLVEVNANKGVVKILKRAD